MLGKDSRVDLRDRYKSIETPLEDVKNPGVVIDQS